MKSIPLCDNSNLAILGTVTSINISLVETLFSLSIDLVFTERLKAVLLFNASQLFSPCRLPKYLSTSKRPRSLEGNCTLKRACDACFCFPPYVVAIGHNTDPIFCH